MPDDLNAEIDSEGLQAQIDLSMSLAFDMVASWMKVPEGSKLLNDDNDDEDQKELEKYLRRPTTLGVGAPIPSLNGGSDALTTRETLKLKQALTKGASSSSSVPTKRSRDETAGSSSSTKTNGKPAESSDDEEDSRAESLSSKKARPADSRLSVFELKPKKKKRKNATENSFAIPALPASNTQASPPTESPLLLMAEPLSPSQPPSGSQLNGRSPNSSPTASKASPKPSNPFGSSGSGSSSQPPSPGAVKRIFPTSFDSQDDDGSTQGSSQTLYDSSFTIESQQAKSQTPSRSPSRKNSLASNNSSRSREASEPVTPRTGLSSSQTLTPGGGADSEDEEMEEASTRTPTPSINGSQSGTTAVDSSKEGGSASKRRKRKKRRRKKNNNADANSPEVHPKDTEDRTITTENTSTTSY